MKIPWPLLLSCGPLAFLGACGPAPPAVAGTGGTLGSGGDAAAGGSQGSGGAGPSSGGQAASGGSSGGGSGGDTLGTGGDTLGTGGDTLGTGGDLSGSGGTAPAASPAAESLGEDRLALSGLDVVSYGGYLNGEAFQQDGIVSFGAYQYTAFWNLERHVVLARRTVPTAGAGALGAWEKFDFIDYTLSADDAHNTISLGVSPADGVLHLAFDHHGSPLHYRRSLPGLLTSPETVSWSSDSFTAVTDNLTGSGNVTLLTYPRFVTRPSGDHLLLSARIGESGSGDEQLWEYDAGTQTWQSLGEYIDGTTGGINAYLHGLAYGPDSERLYAAWCWRETPDASTNFGLYFSYSDDHGRTFRSDDGTTVGEAGQTPLTSTTPGLEVWDIPTQRGLINQEHMTVDRAGRVHVLLSHMPDAEPNRADFTRARASSEYFVYTRMGPGAWRRSALGEPAILNFRGKIVTTSTDNVYAVLPDLRIVAASPSEDFTDWTLLVPGQSGRFFSDPLIDTARVQATDLLTVYYPAADSVDIWAVDFALK